MMSIAYRRLHDAGLRVSVPQRIQILISSPLYAVAVTPAAGHRVRKGSAVTLRIGCPGCGGGGLAAPLKQPSYRVPNFVGHHASVAYAWVRSKVLLLDASLGPIVAGDAATLFGNYEVTTQEPPAGSMLKFASSNGELTPLGIFGRDAGLFTSPFSAT